MLLKIALNGARPRSEHAHLPQTPAEVVEQVRPIYALGFRLFHIHVYNAQRQESLKPGDVAALMQAVKNISAQIQVSISSGEWIEPDLAKRLVDIRAWQVLPDWASVNLIEDQSLAVIKALLERGVQVEAGLNEPRAAEMLVNSPLKDHIRRVLIEPEADSLAGALQTVREIETVLDQAQYRVKRLLHGFHPTAWDLLKEAQHRGYDGRMGMEDTIQLDDGQPIRDNFDLIQRAVKILDLQ